MLSIQPVSNTSCPALGAEACVSLSLLSCPVQSTRPLEHPAASNQSLPVLEQPGNNSLLLSETWKREFGGWLRHSFFPLGFLAVPAQQPSRSSGCLGCKFSEISLRKFYKMFFKKNQRVTLMFFTILCRFWKRCHPLQEENQEVMVLFGANQWKIKIIK